MTEHNKKKANGGLSIGSEELRERILVYQDAGMRRLPSGQKTLEERLDGVQRLVEEYISGLEYVINDLRREIVGQEKVELDNQLQEYLANLISAYDKKSVPAQILSLTPKEMEISNLIKSGLTSREIARITKSSYKTINTHRHHIRKKLGIIDKNINLSTYLRSI